MDTNQRIRELADMFQLTKTKSGAWTFDLPPLQTNFVLVCLQDSLATIRSKSHSAFAHAWFALHRV